MNIKQFLKSLIKLIIRKILGKKYLYVRTWYLIRRLKKGKFYEENIKFLPLFIKEGDICIDIGANVGEHIFAFAKIVGEKGKIFGFEPTSESFEILSRMIKKMNLKNVEIYKLALGDRRGYSEIIIPSNDDLFKMPNLALSYIASKKEKKLLRKNKEVVEIITLDELKERIPILDKTKFVNCDVEGYELIVLNGGKEFFSGVRPIVGMEIVKEHTQRYNYLPDEIFKFFKELNYDTFTLISEKIVPVSEYQNTSMFYFFIPKEFKIYENSSNK